MDNKELLLLVKRGDAPARDEMINKNTGLVYNIAKRFVNRGYEMEDLYQIGCIGLIKAVDKFETDYGVMFSTYAVPLIMGEIKRFIRDDGAIKVSRSVKENGVKVRREMESFVEEKGREATIEELSGKLNIKKEDVLLALEATRNVESIYKKIGNDTEKDMCLIDYVSDSKEGEESYNRVIDYLTLDEAINMLDNKEKEIIKMRYFDEMSQVEIGKKLSLSQVQVSREEKKILKKLKANII